MSSQQSGSRRDDVETGNREPGSRSDENAALRWVLVDGNRTVITAAISAVVFVVFFVLGTTDVLGVTQGSLVSAVFTSAITGVFTLVSITISINQLVLSRIIGSPEQIRDRMDSARAFRSDAADQNERVMVSPTEPAAFLELVSADLRESALAARDTYRDDHEPDISHDVDHLVETLLRLTDEVDDALTADDLSLLNVLSPVLNNSYSSHINAVRRMRATTDTLSEADRRALDDLEHALRRMNVTRHYFKTLYLHVELANVSRMLLVTGLPAILLCVAVILLYSNGVPWLTEPWLLVAVCAGITAMLVPLVVLTSYGLRLATIAKRTTTFGTFTPVDEMP